MIIKLRLISLEIEKRYKIYANYAVLVITINLISNHEYDIHIQNIQKKVPG